MKRLIVSVIIFTLVLSTNIFAYPQYSAETQKLMEEAGIEYNVPLDEVMSRQDQRKQRAASKPKATQSQNTTVKSPTISYNEPTQKSGFDELRINDNYRDQVWHPTNRGFRMEGFDELRYPDEL